MITLLIIKLIITIVVVVGLSLITEHVSPRIAGLLSGYPTGSAISLFFFGLEIGPEFAAHSAIYNMIGLVAMQTFIYAYYKASLKRDILTSSIIAIASYLMVIATLHRIPFTPWQAVGVPVVSIFLFLWLFRPIHNVVVKNRVALNHRVLFFRALCAASIILFITGVAKLVGPAWSGLFSAFPTTLFPLILIIHFTYDAKHVHAIIKNVPVGIFSLVLYSLSVSLAYPVYGIYWGTLISFVAATVYLMAYQVVRNTRV